MTEHNFVGLVYDANTMVLTAKMYVYGYKRDNVPMDYKPIFQPNKLESKNDNGKNIHLEPFYSFINISDAEDVSKSNGRLDKHIISIWIVCGLFFSISFYNFSCN